MKSNKPTYIPNELASAVSGGVVTSAEQVRDYKRKKTQEKINDDIDKEISGPSTGLKDRVHALEEQVSFEGDFQVAATPADIAEGSGKIASANSVRGAIDVRTGYFECSTAADVDNKEVNAPGYIQTVGGCIKVKMTYANTSNNLVSLQVGSTQQKPLYYDGEPVTAVNTWEAGEVVEVYYDGTSYYANNSSGGGKFKTGEKVKEVGIDAVPTPESRNLVESGGVEARIADIEEVLTDELTGFTVLDQPIKANGYWGSGTTLKHTAIAVEKGDIYFLKSDNEDCRYALATTDEVAGALEAIPLVPGTDVVTMSNTGTYYKVTINDARCTHLLFNIGNSSFSYNTRCFKLTDKRVVDTIADMISDATATTVQNNNARPVSSGGVYTAIEQAKADTMDAVCPFVEAPTIAMTRRLKEMYLTGLNPNETYHANNFRILAGKLQIYIRDSNDDAVASFYAVPDTFTGLVPLNEANDSGVSGYMVVDMPSDDTDNLGGFNLVNAVVSDLSFSPYIKTYIETNIKRDTSPTNGSKNLVESGGVALLTKGGNVYNNSVVIDFSQLSQLSGSFRGGNLYKAGKSYIIPISMLPYGKLSVTADNENCYIGYSHDAVEPVSSTTPIADTNLLSIEQVGNGTKVFDVPSEIDGQTIEYVYIVRNGSATGAIYNISAFNFDSYVKYGGINTVNLSKNGETYVSKSEARAIVPNDMQFRGLELKYILNGKWVNERFAGNSWSTDDAGWEPVVSASSKYNYEGRVSIIGDSISTFKGYLLPGYGPYYPDNSTTAGLDVYKVDDTWWGTFLKATGCELEVNASWSGSAATPTTKGGVSLPSFYDRSLLLGNPDIIFVALGTNDWDEHVAVGELDFDTPVEEMTETTFADAYVKGVKSMLALYPNAMIILMQMYMGFEYANIIKAIGEHYGLEVIDVRSHGYACSNGHPTKAFMKRIAGVILDGKERVHIDDFPTETDYASGEYTFAEAPEDTTTVISPSFISEVIPKGKKFTVEVDGIGTVVSSVQFYPNRMESTYSYNSITSAKTTFVAENDLTYIAVLIRARAYLAPGTVRVRIYSDDEIGSLLGGIQTDNQYFTVDDIVKYASDGATGEYTESFSFYVEKGSLSNKNMIVTATAHYVQDENVTAVPTIKFEHRPDGKGALYTSTVYTIGNSAYMEEKQWRVPPFIEGCRCRVIVTIPEGVTLYIRKFENCYSNEINRNVAGYKLNAHMATQNIEKMNLAAKMGYPACVVIPKKIADGTWVCFHDEDNINGLVYSNGQVVCQRETVDNAYVYTHYDENGNVLDNNPIPVSSLTFDELQNYYIKEGNVYTNIPKLEDFFKICSRTGMNPMMSVHPGLNVSEYGEIKAMATRNGVLDRLELKPLCGDTTCATITTVFGNSIKSVYFQVGNKTSSEGLAYLANYTPDRSKVDVGVTINLVSRPSFTAADAQPYIEAGYTVVLYHPNLSEEEFKYWMDNGVHQFTDNSNYSSGLNW